VRQLARSAFLYCFFKSLIISAADIGASSSVLFVSSSVAEVTGVVVSSKIGAVVARSFPLWSAKDGVGEVAEVVVSSKTAAAVARPFPLWSAKDTFSSCPISSEESAVLSKLTSSNEKSSRAYLISSWAAVRGTPRIGTLKFTIEPWAQ
jgi:hypothetical protein